MIGIDVGIAHFSTDTEGLHIANPKYYRKAQEELRRKQRKVSRRKKGSNRRKKAVKELARVHRKVANMRLDFLHKTANYYITNFQMICVEALKVKNALVVGASRTNKDSIAMVKNHHLSKSIADLCPSEGMLAGQLFLNYSCTKRQMCSTSCPELDFSKLVTSLLISSIPFYLIVERNSFKHTKLGVN